MVKLAVRLADEHNRNITESDVIESMTVADVMDTDIVSVRDTERVSNIIKLFSSHHFPIYPVVNSENKLIGILTLDNIKGVLLDQQCWNWLLAEDVLVPIDEKIYAQAPLIHAMQTMERSGFNHVPVVETDENNTPLGMLNLQRIRTIVQERLIKAQTNS
jgi:CBS domain-containing protein